MRKVWKCNYCSHIENDKRDSESHEKECPFNPRNKDKPQYNEDVRLAAREFSIALMGKFVARAKDMELSNKDLVRKLGISTQQFHELKSGLLGLDIELLELFERALDTEIKIEIGTPPESSESPEVRKIVLGDATFKVEIAEEGEPSSIEIREKPKDSGNENNEE